MESEAHIGRVNTEAETALNRGVFVRAGVVLGVSYLAAVGLAHLSFVNTCNGVKSRGQIAEELQGAFAKLGSNDENFIHYQNAACKGDAARLDRRTLLAKFFLF